MKVTLHKDEGMRVPLKDWAVNAEAGAIAQGINLTKLPFALKHVALMPDTHQGYGMPIGGVLFADAAVVPYAVGVDIGCGVTIIYTDVEYRSLTDTKIHDLLTQIARDVPVGNGPQAEHRKRQGEAWEPSGEYSESRLEPILERADLQLGTLGGGNHFLELQGDDDGNVYFMLHSGSRSVGKKVCDYWHGEALALNKLWFSDLPDKELAYLPAGTDEFKGYMNDMKVAMEWAEENRRRMAGKVISAFGKVLHAGAWQDVDVHHNYAAWENHFGKNGIVHRKGAVRAREDELVLIPGSMGTASYIARGLGNPESFQSCQHGAGRARSRGDTRRMTTLTQMDAQLVTANVQLVTPDRKSVIDESPIAYKDIEEVMNASADLVEPLVRLFPIGVVKG